MKDKIFLIILTSVFIILAGILAFSNLRLFLRMREASRREEEMMEMVDRLEKEKELLEESLGESEDSEYWEEKIREQGYKKEGESVVVIQGGEQEEQSMESFGGFWTKVLGLFKTEE